MASTGTAVLTCQDIAGYCAGMASIKISSKIEEEVWNDLRRLADESHQNISGLLTDAVREYVGRRRVRPDVLRHLEDSIALNEELGRRLAR